jgi:hypothetical protein
MPDDPHCAFNQKLLKKKENEYFCFSKIILLTLLCHLEGISDNILTE